MNIDPCDMRLNKWTYKHTHRYFEWIIKLFFLHYVKKWYLLCTVHKYFLFSNRKKNSWNFISNLKVNIIIIIVHSHFFSIWSYSFSVFFPLIFELFVCFFSHSIPFHSFIHKFQWKWFALATFVTYTDTLIYA